MRTESYFLPLSAGEMLWSDKIFEVMQKLVRILHEGDELLWDWWAHSCLFVFWAKCHHESAASRKRLVWRLENIWMGRLDFRFSGWDALAIKIVGEGFLWSRASFGKEYQVLRWIFLDLIQMESVFERHHEHYKKESQWGGEGASESDPDFAEYKKRNPWWTFGKNESNKIEDQC